MRKGEPLRALPILVLVLVCYAAKQLSVQLQEERIQVVRSNREAAARKRPTESNGTPTMDLGHINVGLDWCICMLIAVVE